MILNENLMTNNNTEDQFISRNSIIRFLNEEKKVKLEVEFTENRYCNDFISVYIARVSKEHTVSDEHAWYSISSALNDDEFEMTTRDFVPLTLEDFKKEVSKFCSFYQIKEENYFLYAENKPTSVLRLGKDLHSTEYLLKYDREYFYILTEMNVT